MGRVWGVLGVGKCCKGELPMANFDRGDCDNDDGDDDDDSDAAR